MKEQHTMALTITSVLGEGENREEYTLTSRGQLRMASGVNSLTYTEDLEGKKVHTTLTYRLHANRVHLKKRGGMKSEIILEENFEHTSLYEIPPYSFDMTVRSQVVKASLGADGGEIVLSYQRTIGGDTAPVEMRIVGIPMETEDDL